MMRLLASMALGRRFLIFAVALLLSNGAALAEPEIDSCAGPGKSGGQALIDALEKQPTCAAAHKLLMSCLWGSSADTQFSAVVVAKCEQSFVEKLSPEQMRAYGNRMQLCGYRYARQSGTMFMSMASVCQADIAAGYAENLEQKKAEPFPKASFDCAKAKSPLELAICSHGDLGRADLVLADAYAEALQNVPGKEREALVARQRKWLADISKKCGLGNTAGAISQKTVSCLRNGFELRFTAFDDCEGDVGCLVYPKDEQASADDSPLSDQRASFDCDNPKTPLELVICADADLGQNDIRLAKVYREVQTAIGGEALRKGLIESERNWLKFISLKCPLGPVGGIPSLYARICVNAAFETRIQQLQECVKKPENERLTCLNDFRVAAKNNDAQ